MALDIAGAILAGGQGTRLGGRPKAFLPLGPSGETLIEVVIARLSQVADPILIASSLPEGLGELGLRIVPDLATGKGPLAAIASVLEASPLERVIVVACDMPSLSPGLLEHLARVACSNERAPAVVPRTSAGLHPLHAVYSRSILPELRSRLESGSLALHEALASVGAIEVGEDELRRFDPGLASLENLNTPEDVTRAFGRDRARAALEKVRPRP